MSEILSLLRTPLAKILTRLILYGLVALFGWLGIEQFEAGNEAVALGLAAADVVLLIAAAVIDKIHHDKDTTTGLVNSSMQDYRKPPTGVLLLCLAGAVLLSGCTGFTQSQTLQVAVMEQFRGEMVAYHEKVTHQISSDKKNTMQIAWLWSLQQATDAEGKIDLAAVLEKDAKRQEKLSEIEAGIAQLDADFKLRIDAFDRGIDLAKFTLDAMGQWSRAGKALEGIFVRRSELEQAEATLAVPVE